MLLMFAKNELSAKRAEHKPVVMFHLQFLKIRYPETGSTQSVVEGWETIEFEVHLACESQCRVQVISNTSKLRHWPLWQ